MTHPEHWSINRRSLLSSATGAAFAGVFGGQGSPRSLAAEGAKSPLSIVR